MTGISMTAMLLLQDVPPRALVLAMALSYALSFMGLLLAWRAWRKRHHGAGSGGGEKREP